MLKNYLLVALRNLRKNKIFSLINITGLALGMACSLLIMLWVQDERRVDSFHENGDYLYSVFERQFYDGKTEAFHGSPGIMAEEMKKVLPEVKYASGFAWNEKSTFAVGDKILKEEGNFASPDFFRMMSYKIIEGSDSLALKTPQSIAISRKMAKDFFGSPQAAIGKAIKYEDRKNFMITAVFEDAPKYSSQKFDFIANWETFLDNNNWARDWGNNGPRTYIQLREDANPVAFEKKIRKFLDAYNKDQDSTFRIELGIQRMREMYLHSNFTGGELSGGRIEYVRLFSVVAVFILLIACINFMNLTTAKSVKRAKEIGVRKVVGALRSVLMRQFIGEAILLAFISILISVLIIMLLMPAFNELTGKQLVVPFGEPAFWLALAGLTVLTGIFSGLYPAVFLSAFRPVTVLKGTLKFSSKAAFFRKGLVVFQFVLSIALIIATIVVSNQVEYIQTKNLGYDRENLIYIPLEGELKTKYALFKEEVLRQPGIKLVTRMSQAPTQIENGTGGVEWEGKDPSIKPMFTQLAVGYDFARSLNIRVLQGRDYSRNFASDSAGYIVNEQALKRIGYKDPIGKPLTFWDRKGTIIGVVKDFHFNSFHEPINPLIIRLGETNDYGAMIVRTQPGKTREALSSLERTWKSMNSSFPFTYQFSDEEYRKLYSSEQVVSRLSRSFAFLAIFISCLGLLGLAMFTAEQRTKEMGIRKVLGASVASLFSLMSKQFLFLVMIALLIAFPLAWWAMNYWLEDFQYRITISWQVFAIAGFAAFIIALFTISFQAARAAISNPVKSLRTE